MTFRIAAICGSLRKQSFNRLLLNAIVEELPAGMEIEIFPTIETIPPFNVDTREIPPPVKALIDLIAANDALLISSPEYNYGIAGVLKNALDWLPLSTLQAKPVAVVGASIGNFGTVRAQLALRQTLLFMDSRVVTKPEICVFRADTKFDAQGKLIDETSRSLIGPMLQALRALHVNSKAPVP